MGKCKRCGQEYPESGYPYCFSCIASNADLRARYEGIGIKLDWEELRREQEQQRVKGPRREYGYGFLLVGILIGIVFLGAGFLLLLLPLPGLLPRNAEIGQLAVEVTFTFGLGIASISVAIYEFVKERRKISENKKSLPPPPPPPPPPS